MDKSSVPDPRSMPGAAGAVPCAPNPQSRTTTESLLGPRKRVALTANEPVLDGRSVAAPPSAVVVCANLELRPDEYQALADGQRIGLTVREFEVLLVLACNRDRVVRRTHIYERVWGGEMKYRERAVDVFVRKVRNKLTTAAPGWLYIHTHFGVGYRLTPEQLDPRVELS